MLIKCTLSCHYISAHKISIDLPNQLGYKHISSIVAGWSSLVARRAHNPKVKGSNPFPATKKNIASLVPWTKEAFLNYGGLAQLARASDSYSLGPGFESLNRHHISRG
jgi:hypothetical protein